MPGQIEENNNASVFSDFSSNELERKEQIQEIAQAFINVCHQAKSALNL